MAMVKGTGLVYAKAFVTERFGDDAWNQVLAGVSPADGRQIRRAEVRCWYELRLLALLEQRIASELGGEQRLVELGRFEADRALNAPMRWFFRLISPDFALRHIDLYWRRFHSSGRWTSEVRQGTARACLFDWGLSDAHLCTTLTSYFGRVLELIGNPVPVKHSKCRARGDAHCELSWPWRQRQEPLPPISFKPGDVIEIGHVLTQIPDRGALAQAITCTIVKVLGHRRAVLWDGPPGLGAPLASAGPARWGDGPVQCFLLDAQGQAMGHLEIEAPEEGAESDALEQLLPWLGVALASVPRPADPARELQERIKAGSRQWRLTAREEEVCGRIARGGSNKEIACQLGVAEGTVEIHVSNIFRKSGVENRASLIARLWGLGSRSSRG